ncbi:biotin/lipoyl attachment [Rhodospirillum rubrum F11]|uniref:Biotin/lipoyl attachment n=1 Tax=Rhodospirillum rubrum (strain ATCC 11170 / ATH 1.1.1 / DSM 467 / LMG 4362 / NCIMB 8255 / S1) TaxID=269796 RepID=Q2RUR6_RHORT|nr:biotin/lipoyl-containing protein [Rhodospirillum rubrum]ABC22129.1 Biotin/lipoyl attachment [Rhodospirillum rubrum ATCC 11170]AEO47844.1 biotin/lipoyl attachment [Rhodospirillum rubrum F11]MBK5953718.1 acetyl-CoA carboxylase biotin carboxyl carrier protein subunit [Rhodospirillum rubrum]QXG81778.1 acetyl-CoA carboxylase biotin carboxyl carrier protein subunit [Rhodospirillum rubrum]
MDIKAKMPSVIVSIDVAVGATVTKGQTLVVIEAMKMKNNVPAPIDGTVKSIAVAAGDRLKPGALMMVVE